MLDLGFVDEQDGNVVADRIGAVAGGAFQHLALLVVSERLLGVPVPTASRADQDVEQFLR